MGPAILVCGGRDYYDAATVDRVLSAIRPRCIVHGACPTGADALASRWAAAMDVAERKYSADWERYGKAAGPIRNAQMLREEYIDLVVAFPGGRGTENMVKQAKEAGFTVLRVE